MEESNKATVPHPKSTPSRQGLYAYAARYTKEAIDTIVEIMRTSKNESLKLGAANKLLDKNLPDIKALEVSGENGEPIRLNIITGADYVSKLAGLTTSPNQGTFGRSSEIQSLDLAQTGEEDNNSNQSNSEVEST